MIPGPTRSTLFPYTTLFRSTLEWQTPDTPPKHGNWGPNLPEVHRWAYDYNVPGVKEDFIPQNVPADDRTPAGRSEEPRLNSSHGYISYAVFCLKKKTQAPPA